SAPTPAARRSATFVSCAACLGTAGTGRLFLAAGAVSGSGRLALAAVCAGLAAAVAGQVAPPIGLEVGFIPAAAGQTKAGGRYLALERRLTTLRAVGQIRIRQFLQPLHLFAACTADIFINRHTDPRSGYSLNR